MCSAIFETTKIHVAQNSKGKGLDSAPQLSRSGLRLIGGAINGGLYHTDEQTPALISTRPDVVWRSDAFDLFPGRHQTRRVIDQSPRGGRRQGAVFVCSVYLAGTLDGLPRTCTLEWVKNVGGINEDLIIEDCLSP